MATLLIDMTPLSALRDGLAQMHDVTHLFDAPPPILDPSEQAELTECAAILLDEKIRSDPLAFAQPRFHEELYEDVASMLVVQLEGTPLDELDLLEEEVYAAVAAAARLVFSVVAPRRSCRRTLIRKPPNVSVLRRKIEFLRSVPQEPQRTAKWHSDRWQRMTAATMHKCFGTLGARNQIRYDKCKPIDTSKFDHVSTETAMHHGTKYEPVSTMLYEREHDTIVEEFGCIPHQKHSFIGASPDGINAKETSPRYGRMVEIKNIVNRPITGIPKFEYWIQMQIQMETCDLNECDFLETRFIEYASHEEFLGDGTFTRTSGGQQKGAIMYFVVDGRPFYAYSPLDLDQSAFEEWETRMMEEHAAHTWVKNIYWRLDQLSCVLVLRNKLWFEAALPVIEETWNDVLRGREEGYEQYAPRSAKRPKQAGKCDAMDVGTIPTVNIVSVDTSTDAVTKDAYLQSILEELEKHAR